MKSIDVIIVSYDCRVALHRLLSCFLDNERAGFEVRILVFENGEDLDQVESITANCDSIILRKNPRNLGFAASVNLGIEDGDSDYIVLSNPDARVSRLFLKNVIDFFERQPDVGIMGPRVLNDDGSLQGSARAFPNLLTGLFGRASLLSQLFPTNCLTRKNVLDSGVDGQKVMEVDWVSGACMVVRRKAIEEVGLLDERFFMYWEDADWCRRMREKGWKVIYNPSISVYHSGGQSSRKRPIRSLLAFTKSAHLLYAKYAKGSQRLLGPFVFGLLSLRFYTLAAIMLLKSVVKYSGPTD